MALARWLLFAVAIPGSAHVLAQKSAPEPPQESAVGFRLAADLTWTQRERDAHFAHMDRLFPVHRIAGSQRPRSLAPGTPLPLTLNADSYMKAEHLAGLLVLQDGRIRFERYRLGLSRHTRWTSFSITKAVTDTLVGVAQKNGALHSLDDEVVRYLPEMRGTAYDGVTVRQLMSMTSGAGWTENYTRPDADNVLLYTAPAPQGENSTVAYMRQLHRVARPGEQWRYNTGETDLLGVLLRRATGRSLAQQLAPVWQAAGAEDDATWIVSSYGSGGEEFGGSGLSATLRDFGRLGLWVLAGGGNLTPEGWFTNGPMIQAGAAAYRNGWWPQPDGSFAALGIFGQSILVDPSRKLVIVMLGDWPEATGPAHAATRAQFWDSVKAIIDKR